MENEKVTIIIPVYNAEKYIAQAIDSAVNLVATGEILLVNDGYPDRAWHICREYAERYPIIKLLEHPNGGNRGAAASRNLGIKNAKFNFIAFLDADDFFLPNRFSQTFHMFQEHSEIDAVYEPVGTLFETHSAKAKFAEWRKISIDQTEGYLTYLREALAGRQFLVSLLKGNNGSPHLNGITFKKSLIARTGEFNVKLKLHQDSEFWTRAAYYGHFSPVETPQPVAIRRVHEENRIRLRNFTSRYQKDRALYEWSRKEVQDKKIAELIKKNYAISSTFTMLNTDNVFAKIMARVRYLSLYLRA